MQKRKLLLHCCCAPCSTAVIERLDDYDITMYFFNPNIVPPEEYDKRLGEQRKLSAICGIKLIETQYNAVNVSGDCERCIALRLDETARYAKDNNFGIFTTTLSVSPHKDAALINRLLSDKGKQYGVEPLCADFKKQDGFKRSAELSREYGLYRQNYCGCKL